MDPQFTGWYPIQVAKRPDIVGVRTLASGQREFLMHNKALCVEYYVAKELVRQ